MRALVGEIHADGPAGTGAEHGRGPAAERLRVVGRVRPSGHQRRRGGPREAQLVEEPGGLGQRRGHAGVPFAATPSARSGASARANRSAQAMDTASTAATVP